MPFIAFLIVALSFVQARGASDASPSAAPSLWMKIKAADKFERTKVAALGVSIEVSTEDYVFAIGSAKQAEVLRRLGLLDVEWPVQSELLDFPVRDANFHNYAELQSALEELVKANPTTAKLDSIGKSVEGRELWRLRISADLNNADQLPATLIMGGHHAREHVSVEVPLMFAERFLMLYKQGDKEIVRLAQTRDIQIVPMVNPDGAEFDTSTGVYKTWRKNRARNNEYSFGVDLNRNYPTNWNVAAGASNDWGTEVYRGPAPLSEPESRAVKAWIDSTPNTSTLVSLHTYSQLILYPWSGTFDAISEKRDLSVFKAMAQNMSKWNDYWPTQASNLYIASGELLDYAYDAHKIFGFTFEMDPSHQERDGFYPGQAKLQPIFEKNFKPILYLIEMADNPYRAIEPKASAYGLPSFTWHCPADPNPFLNATSRAAPLSDEPTVSCEGK